MKYIGFTPLDQLPFDKGDEVYVFAGTKISTTHPNGDYELKKRIKVKIHDISRGYVIDDLTLNPSIIWVGSGGYWRECDINFISKDKHLPEHMS